MYNKLLVCLVALVAALVVLALPADAAQTSGTCGENATWAFDAATGTLTVSGEGALHDYPYSSAIEYLSPWTPFAADIKHLIIEEGIVVLGEHTFSNLPNLTSVSLPDTLTIIKAGAFFNNSSLKEFTIPKSVVTIERSAFGECYALTSITIPDSVTSIGTGAFTKCRKLQTVVLSNSLTELPDQLFSECQSLTSITLPQSLTTIGSSAFNRCSQLKEITIPNSVTVIASNAFSFCERLEKVVLSASLTEISSRLFEYCSKLTSISLPEGIAAIGSHAFGGCKNLTKVTIPASVTSIGNNAFYRCNALQEVVVLGSPEFGLDVFVQNGHNLRLIRFLGDAPVFAARSLDEVSANCYYPANNPTWTPSVLQNYSGTITWVAKEDPLNAPAPDLMSGSCGESANWKLENGVLIISGTGSVTHSQWDLYKDQIVKLVIQDGITETASGLFVDCINLEEISLPTSLTSIEPSLFLGCTSLREVTIPASITWISDSAFCNCSGLTKVTFPEKLEAIGQYAFQNCTSLKEIEIPDSVSSIDNYAFRGCTSLVNIKLPATLTTIEPSTFEACTALQEITFPASLTSIGNRAFAECASLTKIRFLGDMPSLHSHSFDKVNATILYPPGNTSWTTNRFPWIGGTMTVMADTEGAEYRCGDNLTWTFENGVLTISGTGPMYDLDKNTFHSWEKHRLEVTKIIIEEGVTTLGYAAFSHFENLESIQLPNTLTHMGQAALQACYKLSAITLPENLQVLGEIVFDRCTGLTTITIPASVTKINDGAFNGCTALKEIYFLGDAIRLEEVFWNVTATAYYPANNKTWTKEMWEYCGGNITWVPLSGSDSPDCGDSHSYGNWMVVSQPTVEAEGLSRRICSVCKHTEEKSIPKLDPPPTELPATSEPVPPTTEATEVPTTEATEVPTTKPLAPSTEASIPESSVPQSQTPGSAPTEPDTTNEPENNGWITVTILVISLLAGSTAAAFLIRRRAK